MAHSMFLMVIGPDNAGSPVNVICAVAGPAGAGVGVAAGVAVALLPPLLPHAVSRTPHTLARASDARFGGSVERNARCPSLTHLNEPGTPYRIRTDDLRLERAVSWATRRTGQGLAVYEPTAPTPAATSGPGRTSPSAAECGRASPAQLRRGATGLR